MCVPVRTSMRNCTRWTCSRLWNRGQGELLLLLNSVGAPRALAVQGRSTYPRGPRRMHTKGASFYAVASLRNKPGREGGTCPCRE